MTGPVSESETHDAITARAAEYFQRRRFWSWSAGDQAELDAWLAESTFHRVAYLRLEGAVASAEELAAVFPHELGLAPGGRASQASGRFFRRRFMVPLFLAASLVLAAGFGILLMNSSMQPADRNFATDVGGHSLVKFADGTEIELNTNTAMRFRMTSAERTVWLEKGEAWFRVAHNAAHPFTVMVGKHRVTDLGTEFSVRRDADDVDVALLKGRAALNTDGTPTTLLSPGDEAVATPVSVFVTRKTPEELADELAWRQGILAFHDKRLDEVVREINRYNSVKLVLTDPAIAGIRVSTDIRTDDYESFVRVAEAALNLHAERKGGVILISREIRKNTSRVAHARRGR